MNVLYQMGYGSLLNSKKQPSDSLRAEATPVFSSLQYCCFLLFCFLFLPESSGVGEGALTGDDVNLTGGNGLYESQTTFPFLWGSNLNQSKPVDPF